jgi:hypothetical protein
MNTFVTDAAKITYFSWRLKKTASARNLELHKNRLKLSNAHAK